MACYVVAYLCNNMECDYFEGNLIKAVEQAYGGFKPFGRHSIFIVTDDSAQMIRDRLVKAIHPRDGLFVLRSGTEAAWKNSAVDSKWLKENL